jgi:large subunit ribosomal protein L35
MKRIPYGKAGSGRMACLGSRTFFNMEHQMPKLKSKSGAKKRFSFTATGKVKANQSGKRHMMRRRSKRFIRDQRGTTILNESDARIVKKFLPYG